MANVYIYEFIENCKNADILILSFHFHLLAGITFITWLPRGTVHVENAG